MFHPRPRTRTTLAALLACLAAVLAAAGAATAATAPTAPAPAPAANNSTTTAEPTTGPTTTLTGAEVRRVLRSVDPTNASRERVARLAAWARDPAHVRGLSAGQVRRLRAWLLAASRHTGRPVAVPGLDLDADPTQPPTTTTPPATTTATPPATTTPPAAGNDSAGGPGSAGYGVVRELTRAPGNVSAQQVEQTIVDGLYVTETRFDDRGFALVTVVVTRPQITFSATDSNSIGDRGSGKVAAERIHLPRGKFTVKVPASVADGDQTIVVGVNVEHSYWFSDRATTDGPGVLSRVGGWTPWIGGVLAALSWVVIAGFVVLAGEQSGVEVAGDSP